MKTACDDAGEESREEEDSLSEKNENRDKITT
jgi:hypothetical protein